MGLQGKRRHALKIEKYKELSGYIQNKIIREKCKRRRRKYRHIRRVGLKNTRARSIEDRSDKVNKRLEYGHWEDNCIVGRKSGKKTACLP